MYAIVVCMGDDNMMSCKDYFESYDYELFNTWFDETYWEGGLTPKIMDAMWNALLDHAARNGVTLTDISEFDYETALEESYAATEKGLS